MFRLLLVFHVRRLTNQMIKQKTKMMFSVLGQILKRLNEGRLERRWLDDELVPYAFSPSERLWVGYDDEESLRAKVRTCSNARMCVCVSTGAFLMCVKCMLWCRGTVVCIGRGMLNHSVRKPAIHPAAPWSLWFDVKERLSPDVELLRVCTELGWR